MKKQYQIGIYILAEVPQYSILWSILYLLYTTDNSTKIDSMTTVFTGVTNILTISKDQQTSTDNLQISVDSLINWTKF